MIHSERAARLLHNAMVRSLAKAQKRIVMHKMLLSYFGKDVVPQEEMLQSASALKRGAETMNRLLEQDQERVREFTQSIRELEDLFEQKNEADMADIVAYLKQRHGLK